MVCTFPFKIHWNLPKSKLYFPSLCWTGTNTQSRPLPIKTYRRVNLCFLCSCRCEISKNLCCRNLAVEKAVSELPTECTFCLKQFPRSSLERHQKEECQDRFHVPHSKKTVFYGSVLFLKWEKSPQTKQMFRTIKHITQYIYLWIIWRRRRSYLCVSYRRCWNPLALFLWQQVTLPCACVSVAMTAVTAGVFIFLFLLRSDGKLEAGKLLFSGKAVI